jgi:hypothetical protein
VRLHYDENITTFSNLAPRGRYEPR